MRTIISLDATQNVGGQLSTMMKWNHSFELGIKFKCLRCASCCKSVRQGVGLTDRDYQRIHKATHRANFSELVSHPVFSFQLIDTQGKCVFLDGKFCSIYKVRPLLCRLYPFQVAIKHDGRLLLCITHCPGVHQPNGEPIDERYILDEIIAPMLQLEGRCFIKTLQAHFLSIKKQATPLLQTRKRVIYSGWKAKNLLEKLILNLLHSELSKGLTPWERLECIYNNLLPLLLSQIESRVGALASELDVIQGYESVKNRIDTTLVEYLAIKKTHRVRETEKLKSEGLLFYGPQGELLIARSPDEKVPIRDPIGEEHMMQVSNILRPIPISKAAIGEETAYLKEIIEREGMYGALVCDVSVDAEISILLRVADAVELNANAFAAKNGRDCIGTSEIINAIRRVDSSLTDIAASVITKKDYV